MSSSEGEGFEEPDFGSGSDSDVPFEPPTKKAATKAKAPASKAKAPAKPKAAPKGKKAAAVVSDRDDDAMDVDDEGGDESDGAAGPSVKKGPAKKKTATETYQKLTQLEHILKRPDSYIGSVEHLTTAMWTFDPETKRMVFREVTYVPGFFKIVDEILVNAADNKINDPSMDALKVEISVEKGTISVLNTGNGIPIEMHETEKMYIPELVFGHLLSGSNYDDDEKKLTGGRNGYGAKLANIYSHEFTIETADKSQKYIQTWTENMGKCGKAKITKNTKGGQYTKVTFRPDLARFGMDSIDDDTLSLLHKRVYDMAGTVKDIKVLLNGEKLKIKGFKSYVDLYLNSAAEQAAATTGAAVTKPSVVYEKISERWEVGFAVSDGSPAQVSFANSISTIKGGTHVNVLTDQIAKTLIPIITKKNKGAVVKPAQIKAHMWIFVNALIENPTFDSQTKETLTLPASKFGTKPVLSDEFMKKLQKTAIMEHVLNWAQFKAEQQVKKTDGSKRTRLTGMAKLSDANKAGSKDSRKCTLILTEGDSAKALAMAGVAEVGRDFFGAFPLRGKILNVREAKHDQIMKNAEIQAIKKILGLQSGKVYTKETIGNLRYGTLMIMTDQDHDGSHIKGLLINLLDHFFPSLLTVPGFLVEFVTPIVRVTKGNQKKDFFTIPEFEEWQEETPGSAKWTAKYYKGLGTSTDADAKQYFSNMGKHMIPFAATEEGDKELIELAFSKKKADERKDWLRGFKPGTYLDHNIDEIPYADFINKELILFSMADNIRSIPSVADGLKPGQRKIIWACFKRKLKKEIKVAQLVGYVSEHAAYHHGEASLSATIVNLAQTYVGSNNLNLLAPNGQYGTRDEGGKDHAAPRYIFTEPTALTRVIFNAADDALLKTLYDDGSAIEPETYIPIVPMVLINGADGIGTGWSTDIPSYNPADIVANLHRLMNGQEMEPMSPWWRGFKGNIKKMAEGKWDVTGVATKINDTTVEISELPIHKWTLNFKTDLEALIGDKGDGDIKDYSEHHDNHHVNFVINMSAKGLEKAMEKGLVEYFKLTTKVSGTNMMAFGFDQKIKKYATPEAILEDFYPVRLAYYQKRKDHLSAELQKVFDRLTNQARFIQMIVNEELSVSRRKKADIVVELRKFEFHPFPKVAKAKAAGEDADALEDEDDDDNDASPGGPNGANTDFDYLLGMPIYSLTVEKIEKLLQQAAEKEVELLALLAKSPLQTWNEDLDHFMEEWDKSCDQWTNAAVGADKKKKKGAQKTLVTRKSIGKKKKVAASDDDSDGDDFMPTAKAAAKRKAPEPKAKKPASKLKKEDDDDDEPLSAPPKKRVPAKKALKEESDDEGATSAAPATKKRAVKKVEEDDGDVVVAKAAPKRAPAKKKVVAKAESGDDSDVVMLDDTKGKGKAKAAPVKRKVPEGDDDSDDEAYIKPAAKKAKSAAVPRKVSARKPLVKKVVKKKKGDDSESEGELSGFGSDPPSAPPVKRVARTTAGKKTYVVEIPSDEDEVTGGGDDSMFEDDD